MGTKEILYSQDENLRIQYDMRAFKDYVKLNEEKFQFIAQKEL